MVPQSMSFCVQCVQLWASTLSYSTLNYCTLSYSIVVILHFRNSELWQPNFFDNRRHGFFLGMASWMIPDQWKVPDPFKVGLPNYQWSIWMTTGKSKRCVNWAHLVPTYHVILLLTVTVLPENHFFLVYRFTYMHILFSWAMLAKRGTLSIYTPLHYTLMSFRFIFQVFCLLTMFHSWGVLVVMGIHSHGWPVR